MIEYSKTYRTEIGEEVEILRIDPQSRVPVIAILGDKYDHALAGYDMGGNSLTSEYTNLCQLTDHRGHTAALYHDYLSGKTIFHDELPIPEYRIPEDIFRITNEDYTFHVLTKC